MVFIVSPLALVRELRTALAPSQRGHSRRRERKMIGEAVLKSKRRAAKPSRLAV